MVLLWAGTPEQGALRGTAPLIFERVARGAQVPLHANIISYFMIYQDQFDTNLLQLFTHT